MSERNISAWVSWAALGSSIISVGVLFGSAMGRIDRAEKDIERIQADSRASQVVLNQIDLRTTRIETKLSILLPDNAVAVVDRKLKQ